MHDNEGPPDGADDPDATDERPIDDQGPDWWRSPMLPIYIHAAERAAPLGRKLLLCWHPEVQVFFIFDHMQQPESTLLGWTIVGVAENGQMMLAPHVQMHQISDGLTELSAKPREAP